MKASPIKYNSRSPSNWVSPPKCSYNGKIDEDPSFVGIDEQIQAGRLCIKCIETANVRRKDQTHSKTKLNMHLSFILGSDSERPIQRSTLVNDYTADETSSLAGEMIFFDIEHPGHLIGSEDNDIKLKIELLDKPSIAVEILGEVVVSAARFLIANKTSTEWIPLYQPGDESSNSAINLEFSYMPVKQGVLMLSILECKDMIDPEIGKLLEQARIDFNVGANKATLSIKAENDSGNLSFNSDTIAYASIDKNNWFCDLRLQCHAVINDLEENIIGEKEISILPFVSKHQNATNEVVNVNLVSYSKGKDQEAISMGCLVMRLMFVEAGKLTIKVVTGSNLTREHGGSKNMSPYVLLKMEGKASSMKRKTKSLTEGGNNPIWNEEFSFMVVDHYKVELECYDYDPLTGNCDLIGTAYLSLLPVLQKSRVETWVNLSIENQVSRRNDILWSSNRY